MQLTCMDSQYTCSVIFIFSFLCFGQMNMHGPIHANNEWDTRFYTVLSTDTGRMCF